MISSVIFDMDGVLVNSEPVHQKLESEMYKELGLNISKKEHQTYVGMSSIDMWTKIKETHVLVQTPEQLLDLSRNKYWAALDAGNVELVEGVLLLIGLLRRNDYTLQIASSATAPTIDRVLKYFRLTHFFSHFIGGDQVKKSKPNPEIFHKAARQSGTAPEKCLVIEDSTNGVLAAKSAGMHCVGYANPDSGDQDLSGADIIVRHLSEIDLSTIRGLSN
jgi:beta-phosphoglucomutase-like phosphatase (HAD superfamily)